MADNIFNEVLEHVDIYDVISDFMELTPKGDSYFGLCPFHNDVNKPSLSVKRSEQFFNCFTCHAAGSAIDFVARYQNISNIEACKYIAERYHIDVSMHYRKSNYEVKYEKYYEIMNTASKFFSFLMNDKTYSKAAKEYLYNRGITEEVINEFKIGLSSTDDKALTKQLLNKGYFEPDIEILSLSKGGRDSFIDRIIVPINNERGKPIAFGGRIYKESNTESKYKNPTETPLFKKGNVLFNIDRVQKHILEYNEIIVVEGYMDVIQAESKGIHNMVAIMGTAMTMNQAQILKKYTKNVVLMLDGDKAGLEAMNSVINRLIDAELNYKVVMLKDGLDPDEYLRKYGKDALLNEIKNNSYDRIGYLYELIKFRYGKISSFNIESFKRDIFEELRYINQKSTLELYIKKLSIELDISFEALIADFNSYIGLNNKNNNQTRNNNFDTDYSIKSSLEVAEELLINYSIYSKNYFLLIEDFMKSRINFKTKKYRQLFVKIGNIYDNHKNISREKLIEMLRMDGAFVDFEYNDKISFSQEDLEKHIFKFISDEKQKIRKKEITEQMKEISSKIEKTEEDRARFKSLSEELLKINRSIKNIK